MGLKFEANARTAEPYHNNVAAWLSFLELSASLYIYSMIQGGFPRWTTQTGCGVTTALVWIEVLPNSNGANLSGTGVVQTFAASGKRVRLLPQFTELIGFNN